MKIYIKDIAKYDGQEITLQGWMYNKRSSGKLHFLQLRDGTGEIQAVNRLRNRRNRCESSFALS